MLYVPVVKSKRGELTALKLLNRQIKSLISPLLDALPANPYAEKPRSLVDQLQWVADQVASVWDHGAPLFVDTFDIAAATLQNGKSPIQHLCEQLHAKNVHAIPVTGTAREPEHNRGVARLVQAEKCGVCFRLEREDLLLPSRLGRVLEEMLGVFGILPEQADLLLDLRHLSNDAVASHASLCGKAIRAIPSVKSWRSLVLTGSAMPNSLVGVCERGDNNHLERREWSIWNALANEGLNRYPTFGDYTTVPPLFVEMDTRTIAKHLGPNVKYTIDCQWFISRGKSFQKHGSAQYFDIAREIVALQDFRGSSASHGDRFIADRAAGKMLKPGNPEQWITASVNSHITFMVNSLAAESKRLST